MSEELKIQEQKSLRDEIQELKDSLSPQSKKKKDKPFKLKWGLKNAAKNAPKKEKILVFLLTTLGNIEPKISQVVSGIVYVGKDKGHSVEPNSIFLYEGKIPAMIIPEWDLQPLGRKEYYDAKKLGQTTEAQVTILRMIEQKENLMSKKPFNIPWIWIVLLGAAAAYLFFFKGGGH